MPSSRDFDFPPLHARFLESALERLSADPRIIAVAIGGSALTRAVDEFSDLDLVIVAEPAMYAALLRDMREVADALGALLAAFTGEHVGEPRLLVCLYGPPPLHVDLKVVNLPDLSRRVEDPLVLWARDGRVAEVLADSIAVYPEPDLQWIEDRFWIWVHYTATKIGRGELYEAIDALAFFRKTVLGPLALRAAGERPAGLRRIEERCPDVARRLERTLARHDAAACAEAVEAVIEVYRLLRKRLASPGLVLRVDAEREAVKYAVEIGARSRSRRLRPERG